MKTLQERIQQIKLLVMDVDGVLTDGRIFILPDGEEIKAFNALDGHGLKMLNKTGVALAVITGRESNCVALRMKGLGIEHYFAGITDKFSVFQQLLTSLKATPEQCAYIGDDVVDLPVMGHVGLAVSVPEAPEIVKYHAHLITEKRGGQGAVRELCDRIMIDQGTFAQAMEMYLK